MKKITILLTVVCAGAVFSSDLYASDKPVSTSARVTADEKANLPLPPGPSAKPTPPAAEGPAPDEQPLAADTTVSIDAAQVAKEIREFKKEEREKIVDAIKDAQKKEAEMRRALVAMRPKKTTADDTSGKPGPYLGALLKWADANAELQELKTTLEYLDGIPENMMLPVRTLSDGVARAKTAVQTLSQLNKTAVDLSLRAFKKQMVRKKGQINFKQADYSDALEKARNGVATYYEVLAGWYQGVPSFFNQMWDESAADLDMQIAYTQQLQREHEAAAAAKGFTVGDKEELDITTELPAELADNKPAVPYDMHPDTKFDDDEQGYTDRWRAIHNHLVMLLEMRAAIQQGNGVIGHREMIEQRNNQLEQARQASKEARKQPGSLDEPLHPFRLASAYEQQCRQWYERDAGRHETEELVRQTSAQISQVARDIRMIDEKTPDASAASRHGMKVLDAEMAHLLSPHMLEGNKLISRVTAGIGRHASNLRQMEPIWNTFNNRLDFLLRRSPELAVAVTAARSFLRWNAPGLSPAS